MNYQSTKDKIYCAKHNLEYTKENVKKAMEMELGFGCEVRYIDCGKGIITDTLDLVEILFEASFLSHQYCKEDVLDKMDVLGTPITLEDVLRATDERLTGDYINEGGFLTFLTDEFEWGWQLGRTFDDQSTETKDFVKDLLK